MKVSVLARPAWAPGYMVLAPPGRWLHHEGFWYTIEEDDAGESNDRHHDTDQHRDAVDADAVRDHGDAGAAVK